MRSYPMIAIVLSALLVSCTSTPGTTPVSAADIQQSLSDRTWLWDVGGPGAGIYFAADGNATFVWEGRPWQTTWKTRNGAFCYEHESGDRCWALYERDGVLYSRSLWQPDYPNEYAWDPADNTRPGRHI